MLAKTILIYSMSKNEFVEEIKGVINVEDKEDE